MYCIDNYIMYFNSDEHLCCKDWLSVMVRRGGGGRKFQ